MADPVMYMSEPFEDMGGMNQPGWYFWAEDWATAYGPYESESEARKKRVEYAATL